MSARKSAVLEDHFAELTDPRRREGTYPLINIVVIAVCAVLCGADDFVAIAEFGRLKKKFLEKFLDLSSGIPSHDRFNAIFAAIKPAEFEKCLLSWITALHEITKGQVIAIDGKTLRRSFDTASSKAAIHMVSACVLPLMELEFPGVELAYSTFGGFHGTKSQNIHRGTEGRSRETAPEGQGAG